MQDILATATHLTADTIARAYRDWLLPHGNIDTVIAGGGGTHNHTLMRMLAAQIAPARLATHAEYGLPDDAKEAVAFALLAYETLHGRPSNVPSATGAKQSGDFGQNRSSAAGVEWQHSPRQKVGAVGNLAPCLDKTDVEVIYN